MLAADAAAPTNINEQSQEEFIRLFFEEEVLSQRIVQVCCNTFNQPNFLGAQNETEIDVAGRHPGDVCR